MSYVIIPVQPIPNQLFSVVLDGQQAIVSLMTTDYGLYADVVYTAQPVAGARLCADRTSINPNPYAGLAQFLGFVDLQGGADPVYTGFNSRYLLIYGTPPPTFVSSGSGASGPVPLPTRGWGINYGNNYGGP